MRIVVVGALLAIAASSLAPPPAAAGWSPKTGSAAAYAERRAGDVRFALVDRSGRLHRHRAGGKVLAVSTFKVMLMTAYLRRARDRELTQGERELIGPMIRSSDDIAATEINRRLGRSPIERLAAKAKMRDFTYNPGRWGHSTTSARDQVWFMHRLHHYVPKRHLAYARGLLRRIVPSQRWGFAEAVPKGWRLRFKGGWGSGSGATNHQVAFYERGSCRVSLAVTTVNNPNHDYGSATLKGVARRILRGLSHVRNC